MAQKNCETLQTTTHIKKSSRDTSSRRMNNYSNNNSNRDDDTDPDCTARRHLHCARSCGCSIPCCRIVPDWSLCRCIASRLARSDLCPCRRPRCSSLWRGGCNHSVHYEGGVQIPLFLAAHRRGVGAVIRVYVTKEEYRYLYS